MPEEVVKLYFTTALYIPEEAALYLDYEEVSLGPKDEVRVMAYCSPSTFCRLSRRSRRGTASVPSVLVFLLLPHFLAGLIFGERSERSNCCF